jgi:hypothetical protein
VAEPDPPSTTELASPATEPAVTVPVSTGNGMATAGFVCGLIGALTGLIPILFFLWAPLGICGIVFGSIGIGNANKLPDRKGHGLGVAGVILGVIAIVLPLALCGTLLSSSS